MGLRTCCDTLWGGEKSVMVGINKDAPMFLDILGLTSSGQSFTSKNFNKQNFNH